MVSDQVVVRSKKYDSSNGYLWTSDGKGTFSIEETEYNEIGTEITLSIKKDENEFLSKYKIEEIIKSCYSTNYNINTFCRLTTNPT